MSAPIAINREYPQAADKVDNSVTGQSAPLPKRRASSFTSPSSPWARRRSFLSSSMLSNEKHSVYELSSYYYSSGSLRSASGDTNVPCFSMSLRESQGFIWNQDLFASQYQQARALVDSEDDETDETADARRMRAFSSSRFSDGVAKVEVVEIVLSDQDLEDDDDGEGI